MSEAEPVRPAAPCGLYCGICGDNIKTGECHGCGCDCGGCAGAWHMAHCRIAQCVTERGHESCAACPQLPCTRLVQFCCDPIWRTHRPVIENLRRRQRIGTEAWIAEQEEFWSDPVRKRRWLASGEDCKRRWTEEPRD